MYTRPQPWDSCPVLGQKTLCHGWMRFAPQQRAIPRLEEIANIDDPRIAAGLLAMFADPPFRSRPALPFYKRALEVIARVGHPDLDDPTSVLRKCTGIEP